MRIIIGNIPDDSTEESVREALGDLAPVEAITLVRESSPMTAIIEADMTQVQADTLAKRIKGRSYHGRSLTAWVPKMGWK